jgi:hypothetical protein
VRIWLEYGGANNGGDRPTHVMGSADAVRHAGMAVRWVRWVYRDGPGPAGLHVGPWESIQ